MIAVTATYQQALQPVAKMLIHFAQKWLYVVKWITNNEFATE